MFYEMFCIGFIDISLFFLSYLFWDSLYVVNTTARWFFIHSVTNTLITYYSIYDLIHCVNNFQICHMIPWNENTSRVFWFGTNLHIYHSSPEYCFALC